MSCRGYCNIAKHRTEEDNERELVSIGRCSAVMYPVDS